MFAVVAILIAWVAGLVATFGGGEPIGGLALLAPGLLVAAFLRAEWKHSG